MKYARFVDRDAGGRHGWVVLCYFFLGALLGLFVTTVSAVFAVTSLVAGAPGEFVLGAMLAAVVGVVVLYTHLTEGLKRSRAPSSATAPATGDVPPAPPGNAGVPPLWPSAVYFRVAALVGLIAAVSGAVGVCNALASTLLGNSDVPDFTGYPGISNDGEDLVRGLLVAGVGLLVMWWHLNEARKRGE